MNWLSSEDPRTTTCSVQIKVLIHDISLEAKIESFCGTYIQFLIIPIFLPPANEVCEGYVFTRVCHTVHRGEVSRPTPRGEVGGLAGGRVSRSTPGGWGVWLGSPRPGECIPACTEADTPSPLSICREHNRLCSCWAQCEILLHHLNFCVFLIITSTRIYRR